MNLQQRVKMATGLAMAITVIGPVPSLRSSDIGCSENYSCQTTCVVGWEDGVGAWCADGGGHTINAGSHIIDWFYDRHCVEIS